jgi:alanine dehydrogenase
MNLDEAAVRRVLRMEELIPAMAEALAALSRGAVVQPVRVTVPIAEHHGFLGVMPASLGGSVPALGAKLVTNFPQNRGIHTHHATIVLFRPETGEPLAVMDGRYITEMRTAAISAVATLWLARSDASVLAIIGSGVQARSHLEALRLVRSLRDVRVWSPNNARIFAERYGVRAMASAEAAVRGADIVVTATTAQSPVLSGAWLSPGTHINAVGAAQPQWRELDDEVLRTARIFVESRASATQESGDVIAALASTPDRAIVELGEVVAGAAESRGSCKEVTLFKSLGVAVADMVCADLVYRRTLEKPT